MKGNQAYNLVVNRSNALSSGRLEFQSSSATLFLRNDASRPDSYVKRTGYYGHHAASIYVRQMDWIRCYSICKIKILHRTSTHYPKLIGSYQVSILAQLPHPPPPVAEVPRTFRGKAFGSLRGILCLEARSSLANARKLQKIWYGPVR